jgi:hypothetical protein
MAVVLPAPLAPRKPKISPARTCRSMPIHGREVAEALGQSLGERGVSKALFAKPLLHRMRPGPCFGGDVQGGSEGLHAFRIGILAQGLQQGIGLAAGGREQRAVEGLRDLRRGTGAQQVPGVDQPHAVALRGLVHVGRAHQDGDALLPQVAEHVPELAAAHGVHAGGGLVQHQYQRLVDQGAAQRELLLHATAQRSCAPLREGFQHRVDVADQVVVGLHGGLEHAGEELQVLPHAEVLVQREGAGHVAHVGAYMAVVLHHVATIEGDGAGIGQQQRDQRAEEGALPRAVRADQAEELAFRNAERNVLQRLHGTVVLADVGHFDHPFLTPFIRRSS